MTTYAGFDCSTQSMTVIAIRVDGDRASIAFEDEVQFDRDLPAYGTRHGVLPSADPRVAVSPPLMWAEALEQAMASLSASGLDLRELAAISGSGQQHGSVYLNGQAATRLSQLDATGQLANQLEDVLSREVSPIWMDGSTTEECREITAALGGAAALARLTGSRAFERFTGPQIRRFWKRQREQYEATAEIHLVSSFLASLLIGSAAPIDPGDASGMNLMDLKACAWAEPALVATAPDLAAKLPSVVRSDTVVGRLSPYWQRRFDLPAARVVAWSGDNPCSLIGTGLVREGVLAVSLGTSDTVFGVMRTPRVDTGGVGHVFGAPTGDYMGLTCFRNGALARERIRDAHGLDWAGFSAALEAAPPGNDGALMLPWFEPEMTPDVPRAGVHRQGMDPAGAPADVRGVIEAQMTAMATHSNWMGVSVETIHATGGGATNRAILQVMADVFAADVVQFESSNSACVGAALRAWHADRLADERPLGWDVVVGDLAAPIAASRIGPDPSHAALYRDLRRRYQVFEAGALESIAAR